MATVANVLEAFAYIKSAHFLNKVDGGEVNPDTKLPRDIQQWMDSTIMHFAPVKDMRSRITHQDRHMFSVMQSVFKTATPPSLASALMKCVCEALLELKDDQPVKPLLEAKITAYLEESKLAAASAQKEKSTHVDSASAAVGNATSLADENQRLKEELAELQHKNRVNEEEIVKLKTDKEGMAVQIEKLKKVFEISQMKLEETFATLRDIVGDLQGGDKQVLSLKKLLSFYTAQMKKAVEIAQQNIQAKNALINLVLYSDNKQKDAARAARDYFRATGLIPDDISTAEGLFKQFKKEVKDQDAARMQVRSKQQQDIVSAKVTTQLLNEFKDSLALEADKTLDELKKHSDMIIALVEQANAEPAIQSVITPSSGRRFSEQDAMIASLQSEVARLEKMLTANPFGVDGSQQLASSSEGDNDAKDAPPMAPPMLGSSDVPMAPPMLESAPALTSMTPPMAPLFAPSDAPSAPQDLTIAKSSKKLERPAASANSALFDAIRGAGAASLRRVDRDSPTVVSSPGADSGSSSSMADGIQSFFNRQKLSILEAAPVADALKSAEEKIIFKDATKDWIFVSHNKNKTTDQINISKTPGLRAVLLKLESKQVAAFTNNDKSDILRDVSSYLRTQVQSTSHSASTALALPKQNLELFDLRAGYLKPEAASKFVYLLSKTTEKEWKLELYIPASLMPVGREAASQPNPVRIPLEDIVGFREAVKSLGGKELDLIASSELWDAKLAVKKYHIELIKSGTLKLISPEAALKAAKEAAATPAVGNGLSSMLASAARFQAMARQRESGEDELNTGSPRPGGKTSEWD